MIGSVNGMITGLVAITPGAGFVNGWGAAAVGIIASTIVWFAIRFLSRAPVFRNVDDTLGVVYTHGIAGLTGGLLVGIFADPHIIEYIPTGGGAEALPGFSGVVHGSWTLLRWQAETAAFVIIFSGIMTFILLKVVGIFIPLGSPTRSSRSAITRSTATRSTPRTFRRSAVRTRRRRGNPAQRRQAHRGREAWSPGRVQSPRTRPGSDTTDSGPASAGSRRL